MSKKEAFFVLNSQNAATAGGEGDEGGRLLPQTVVRKKLADISNLPLNQRPLIQENKCQSIEATTREYIDQLQKENMALVKMLAQRNKIIEQSGAELDRLKVNLLKMQEQNQQLALSNSQILAELNSGKDRLKELQHELGCKGSLLKARKLKLEEKGRTRKRKNADTESIKFQEEGESSKEHRDDEKYFKTKQSLQSNNLDTSEQLQSVENIENKRPSARRQSSRFKVAETKPAEDFFEADDTKVPTAHLLPDGHLAEKGSTSENASFKNEDNNDTYEHVHESRQPGRLSLCRPSRQAARKVRSYKETPINIKMRRPE